MGPVVKAEAQVIATEADVDEFNSAYVLIPWQGR